MPPVIASKIAAWIERRAILRERRIELPTQPAVAITPSWGALNPVPNSSSSKSMSGLDLIGSKASPAPATNIPAPQRRTSDLLPNKVVGKHALRLALAAPNLKWHRVPQKAGIARSGGTSIEDSARWKRRPTVKGNHLNIHGFFEKSKPVGLLGGGKGTGTFCRNGPEAGTDAALVVAQKVPVPFSPKAPGVRCAQ